MEKKGKARRRGPIEDGGSEPLLDEPNIQGEVGTHSSLDGDRGNIALLLFLYTLQGVPLGLAAAVPMILQNKGVNYKDQAMFSLVDWPFSLKLMWAPIVDSVFSERFGRRKTWLVPTQYMIGLFMIVLSLRVDYWITDPRGPHTVLLTSLFFMLNFLAATQDIAVDGWALTMLKRVNVGYASTCNSVGQTAGYFLGYVVFMALESEDFCNNYLRAVPAPHGIVTLPGFLYYCGLLFLGSTTLVGLLKGEVGAAHSPDEPSMGILATYRQLLRIIRLPTVTTIAIVLLTCKVSFSACDAVSGLKLVEAGVPREQFAMVAMFLVPLQVALPIVLTKYLVGDTPMDIYTKAYPYRLGFNLLAAGFVWLTPRLIDKHHVPPYYYVMLIILYGLHQVTLYSMFVTQMAFYARVSDPAVGGTYMTLLNTLSNLGNSWPRTLVLLLVDMLTFKQCSNDTDNPCTDAVQMTECQEAQGSCNTWLDGYYVLTALCTVYGLLWMGWGRRTIRALQRRHPRDWTVPQLRPR